MCVCVFFIFKFQIYVTEKLHKSDTLSFSPTLSPLQTNNYALQTTYIVVSKLIMLRLTIFYTLLSALVISRGLAYVVKDIVITVPQKVQETSFDTVHIPRVDSKSPDQLHPIPIDSQNAILRVTFPALENETPEHVRLLLSLPSRHLDQHISPTQVQDKYVFEVPLSEVDRSLLYFATQDSTPLQLSLIVASNGEDNIFNTFGALFLEHDIAAGIDAPAGHLGLLPEIRHVFNPQPTYAPRLIAKTFAILVAITLSSTLIIWASSGFFSLRDVPCRGTTPLFFLLSVLFIAAIQWSFVKYYFSDSILDLIQKLALLLVPGTIVGTKFLRSVQF